MIKAREIKSCRVCGSARLINILSLGDLYLVGFIDKERTAPKAPLTLSLCEDCKLVQLRHTTNPQLLYGNFYGYRSGINKTMRNELASIAKSAEQIVKLKKRDIVVDIGCNDGTELQSFKTKDIIRVGFDPSTNVAYYADMNLKQFGQKNYKIFYNFFNKEDFQRAYPDRKAKIITAIAMFYDIDDPNKFLDDVRQILDRDGVFIIQQNYLVGMLEQCAFDNIVHEHLEYYSLTSLTSLLKRHNMEVIDVMTNDINGGSFRTYIKHKGSSLSVRGGKDRVEKMLKKEKKMGLLNKRVYQSFGRRVLGNGQLLNRFLKRKLEKGETIILYGASTRVNTLLQAYGLDCRIIKAAAERNRDKWGKKTLGTNIPIISEKEARKQATIFFIGPWFFKDEFLDRESEFLTKGGRMLFPLPFPTIFKMERGKLMQIPLNGRPTTINH